MLFVLFICLYKKTKDEYAWRCMNNHRISYKKYFSLRENSFFDSINIPLSVTMRIIIKYSTSQPRYSIILTNIMQRNSILRVLIKLISLICLPDFSNNKLCEPGFAVQLYEIMMNFKYKSHRGRAASSTTDAYCIIKFRNGICRSFSTCIPDKRSDTLVPIIINQVANGYLIWTEELSSYR